MHDPIGHRTVTHAAITRFGELTGDYAAMHFDTRYGAEHGMDGTIAHGLLSGAWAFGALARHAPERLALGETGARVSDFRVRFHRMVYVDDRFALRARDGDAPAWPSVDDSSADRHTVFEVVNQRDEVVTSGTVSVESAAASTKPPRVPAPLVIDAWQPDPAAGPIHAEEMIERGPRGVGLGRTVTEADLVGWTDFTGHLDPAALDALFAARQPAGERVAPPMWVFCRAFGDYLRDLLRAPMPSTGFAGHLGDAWRSLAPVRIGDTLHTRHRPIAFTPSKSRPGQGIVDFALHVVSQRDEIVLEGRVTMMIGTKAGA